MEARERGPKVWIGISGLGADWSQSVKSGSGIVAYVRDIRLASGLEV